jgi:hypothetical protein
MPIARREQSTSYVPLGILAEVTVPDKGKNDVWRQLIFRSSSINSVVINVEVQH